MEINFVDVIQFQNPSRLSVLHINCYFLVSFHLNFQLFSKPRTRFQIAKDELTAQSLQLVHSSKMLVIAMSDPTLPDLPENLAVCLTILRKLTDLCQSLSNHTTSPLQTRNLILKVHDVTAAFRHLITSNVDRSSRATIEEHLAKEAESLANVLTTLLRSLRVFSP